MAAEDRSMRATGRWAPILALAAALAAAGPVAGQDRPRPARTELEPLKIERPQIERHILAELAAGRDAGELAAEAAQVALKRSKRPVLPPVEDAAAGLNAALSGLQAAVEPGAGTEAVVAAYEAFEAQDLLVRREMDRTSERLQRFGIGGEVAARQEAARAHYSAVADRLHAALGEPVAALRRAQAEGDPAGGGKVGASLAAATSALARGAAAAREVLAALPVAEQPFVPLAAANLPYRRASLAARPPRLTPAITPSYLDPLAVAPGVEELEPDVQAPLSVPILLKAEALGYDAVAIYEFVRNEVAGEVYAGAMKGAEATLAQKSGNDVDQASLLVALLRASQVPARYVRGVIELPLERIAAELGLGNPDVVPEVLGRAGLAFRPVVRGGRVVAVDVEHTWVSAHVPYANYRGAVVDFSGRAWVPLAPALKTYDLTPATAVLRAMSWPVAERIDAYLATVQPTGLAEQIREEVEGYLQATTPGVTYESQLGSRTVTAESLRLLPSSLPAVVKAVTYEQPVLDPADVHQVRLLARQGGEGSAPALDLVLPLAQVVGHRLTLSYTPATVEDHQAVNAWGGLYAVPLYLVQLRPQLKLDGTPRATGEATLDMGAVHRFEVELSGPTGTHRVGQTVLAGSYHALAVSAQQALSPPEVEEDPADTERLAARLLSQLAHGYAADWDRGEAELSGLLDVAYTRPLPSVVAASNAVSVEILLGLPYSFRWQGVTLDAALRSAEPVARRADAAAARDWMRLAALEGSALEQLVFSRQFQVDGISADKGLALAREGGIEVVHLTTANIGGELPGLAHPPAVKAEIDNWVRQGLTVDVPRGPVTRNAWSGSVWRVEEPATGGAGYFIAGSLAGGSSSEPPANWILDFLAQALAAPYSAEPNTNPLAVAEIRKIPAGDGQEGEVGQPYEMALAILARDEHGRPVLGAQIIFEATEGGGMLVNAEGVEAVQHIVETSELGIAQVTLKAGTDTSVSPVYAVRNPSDTYYTQALAESVEVLAVAQGGYIVLEAPFSALAYPGPPTQLVATLGGSGFGIAGRWSDTIIVLAKDQYANPVSNVDVSFAVGAPQINCSPPPASVQNAVVFDFANCPVRVPILGECGSPSFNKLTSLRGASAGVILGNSSGATYTVNMTAPSLPPLSFTYTEGRSCNAAPLVSTSTSVLVDEVGNNIQAAKAGETWQQPIPLRLLYEWPEYEVAVAGNGDCFIRFLPGRSWRSTTGQVNYQVSNGGSASGASFTGNHYEVLVTTGLTPAENTVDFQASNIATEEPAVDPESCAEFIRQGQASINGGLASVYGLDPKIVSVDPDPILLTELGSTALPVKISYDLQPPGYSALSLEVNVYEDDTLIGRAVGSTRTGIGEVSIQRGLQFDVEKTYEAELIASRGSRVEVRGERFELPLFQRIFTKVSPYVSLSQDVDLLNQRVCAFGSEFTFSTTQEATVTLAFKKIESTNLDGGLNLGSETKLIDADLYPAGDHSLTITPSDLLPGDYVFELRGTSAIDGHEDVAPYDGPGKATSQFRTHDSLPVGHAMAKGVDLFDGHLSVVRRDLLVPGRGRPLDFTRAYASNAPKEPGVMGVGWSHSYDSKAIVTPCGEIIVAGAEGGGGRFVDDGNGGLRPLKGYHGSLVANPGDNSFDFFAKDGTRYHFGFAGSTEFPLELIADPNGNKTTLTYDRTGFKPKLVTVTDAAGRSLRFTYERRTFTLATVEVVTQIEGPGGLLMNFSYDANGNLVGASRESGAKVETYGYPDTQAEPFESRNNLISIRDELSGATTGLTYQKIPIGVQGSIQVPTQVVTELEEPEGGTTTFTYDTAALGSRAPPTFEVTVKDRRGEDTVYTLNGYGSPLSIVDPEGNREEMEWAADDIVMLSRTDGNGTRSTFTYDADANLLSESVTVTDFDGAGHNYSSVHTYVAGGFGDLRIKNRAASTTNRNGVRTDLTYDGRGNLTRKTVVGAGFTEAYTYAGNGDRRTHVDANGKTSSFSYDSYGNLASSTNPLGGSTSSTWDVRSRLLSSKDPLGRTTRYQYDTLDRLVRTDLPGAAFETTVYDDSALTRTFTDAESRTTVARFDLEGRLVEMVDPLGHRKVFEYDAEGSKTLESNSFGNGTARQDTTFAYDDAGRLVTRTEPLGRVTSFAYDDNGNAIRETLEGPGLAAPQVTESSFDALNRQVQVRRSSAAGPVVESKRFDGEGNVVLYVDPLSRQTVHTYDRLNHLLSTRDPKNGLLSFTYDGNGNRLTETDPLGRVRRMEYDALNRLTRRVDALGNATLFEYDAAGNLSREIDARLNEVEHQYDERNRRTRTERQVALGLNPVGLVATTMAYDKVGNLVEIRHPNGNLVEQTFDALDRLVAKSDNLGSLFTGVYDANGNLLEETDANGNVNTRTYDALNRLLREELPESRTRTYTYDAAGNRLTETDPNDNTTRFVYDAASRLIEVVDPPSVGTSTQTTYDLAGRVVAERDRRGNVTTVERDELGRATRIVDPPSVGTSRSFTYDAVGNQLTETDRRGIVTAYTHDAENRPLTTSRAGVTLRTLQYDKNGNVRFDTDANGNITGYEYDERNLRVAENRPLAAITRYAIDAMGDVVESRDPENHSGRRTYDLRRRVLTDSDGAGNTAAYTYDGNGNELTMQRPEGGIWNRDYDDANRLIRVTDPLTRATEYGYDDNGNRTSMTDARSKVTLFEYDDLDRQTAVQYHDGARDESTLDGNGNVIATHDAKGQDGTFTYDALDRQVLATLTPPTPSTGDDLVSSATTFDANGNLLSVVETYGGGTGTRTTTYAYDDFDRNVSATDPQGEVLAYSYDANGNRTQLRDPDGRLTTYAYDALNRLVSVTVPLSGVTQYEYFKNSLSKRVVYPNGADAKYTYDAANRLTLVENRQTSAIVSSYAYTYDRNANRTQQIEVNGGAAETTTYQFDTADQLTGVDYPDKTVRYTLDAVGNRLTEVERDLANTLLASKSSTYDDRNRVTRVDDLVDGSRSVTYGYDANGNQTSRTQSGVTTDFLYDAENQLVEVQRDSTLVGRYLYDHQGLRVRKAGSGEVLRYVYDDQSVLLQTDDAGNTVARYEYGPDRLLSMIHATEGRQFYLFDGLGSIADLTRPDGTVAARYQYDAWGNPRSTAGSSFNPFGFTGHERDDESGLYYFKARFYDPELGRFLTQDAAEGDPSNPPSLHRYLYAHANPTVFVDPDGFQSVTTLLEESVVDALSKEQYFKFAGLFALDVGYKFADVLTVGFISRHDAARDAYDSGKITGGEYATQSLKAAGRSAVVIAAGVATGGAGAVVARGVGLGATGTAVFAGAVSGVGSQAGGDLVDGQLSSAGDYFKAAGFGAAAGLAFRGVEKLNESGLGQRSVSEIAESVVTKAKTVVTGEAPSGGALASTTQGTRSLPAVSTQAEAEVAKAVTRAEAPAASATTATTAGSAGGAVRSAAKSAADDVVVIGRQVDTAVAKEWPGHKVLDLPDWTLAKNDAWVKQVIDDQATVYLASPTSKANLFDAVANRSTVFGREVDQFLAAGYKRSGDYLFPKSAADRAREILEAVPKATQRRTTIAVTETQGGTRVISSSERRLRPAQRKLLGPGEVEGVGPGHAEVTGINFARSKGLTPTGTAASRPICQGCQKALGAEGVAPLSPLKPPPKKKP